ncbi:hypothetical protein [Nonomuraea harbinensis]|uniref:Uncharacterized protein n=1 Tax=Nonomuraea harbinensis TaxID=1286938 RepID=A0ABW1BKW7_9ACTN|nr:hypothetical protein [Nonomuraea harbinensis]
MNKKRKAIMVMAMFFSVGAASVISAGPAAAMPPNCDFYVCEGQGGGGGGGGTPGGGGGGGGGTPQLPPDGGTPDGGSGGGDRYPDGPPPWDICDIERNAPGCR